jgi:hypothetical protein
MQFSVIYSFDVRRSESVEPYNPPASQRRKLWTLTEGNKQYDFDYLGEGYEHGKHRKWCALLSREEFDAFVQHVGIYAHDVETCGSIGAPGFGFGCAPAISFHGDSDWGLIYQNAYVTPIPEVEPQWDRFPDDDARADRSERVFQRIKRAVVNVYGP